MGSFTPLHGFVRSKPLLITHVITKITRLAASVATSILLNRPTVEKFGLTKNKILETALAANFYENNSCYEKRNHSLVCGLPAAARHPQGRRVEPPPPCPEPAAHTREERSRPPRALTHSVLSGADRPSAVSNFRRMCNQVQASEPKTAVV